MYTHLINTTKINKSIQVDQYYHDGTSKFMPAGHPGVLAIGNLESDNTWDNLDVFKRNIDSQYGSWLDLMVPGEKIEVKGIDINSGGISNRIVSGTSFSAPIITGMISIFYQAYFDKHNQFPSDDSVTSHFLDGSKPARLIEGYSGYVIDNLERSKMNFTPKIQLKKIVDRRLG